MKIFPGPLPNPLAKRIGRQPGYKPHPNQLKSLMAFAVPEQAVLNPYGHYGNCRRSKYRATFFKLKLKPAYREMRKMKRKRLKLEQKKAVALELHELQKMARESATLAMETLIEISSNKRAPEANRIAASAVILDRAYGKASQTTISANVSHGKASDIDSTELDTRISRALKRVEELTNRTPKAGPGKERPVDLREPDQHTDRPTKGRLN